MSNRESPLKAGVKHVILAFKEGATDRTYYLLEGGAVWCECSSNNGYSLPWWERVEPDHFDTTIVDGKALSEWIAEKRVAL